MTDKKSNGQNVPKMEVKKQGEPTTPGKAIEVSKPTYEDLQKRLEQLEKERMKKPATIEEVINFFEEKKKKITQLDALKHHLTQLNDAQAKTSIAIQNKDFEEPLYTFSFSTAYRNSDPLFKISTPEIIQDCSSFLIMRIKTRVQLLEAEIQKDF